MLPTTILGDVKFPSAGQGAKTKFNCGQIFASAEEPENRSLALRLSGVFVFGLYLLDQLAPQESSHSQDIRAHEHQ